VNIFKENAMTRDEATRLVRDAGPIGGVYKSYDEALVDSLAALGILKLDEPLSKDQRVARVLGEFRNSGDGLNGFMNRLEAAGLRIVEK
jgi:hypothetical protein